MIFLLILYVVFFALNYWFFSRDFMSTMLFGIDRMTPPDMNIVNVIRWFIVATPVFNILAFLVFVIFFIIHLIRNK